MPRDTVIFIAPRFHTNQYYLTKQLLDGGRDVAFCVIYKGRSENYSHITPLTFGPSRLNLRNQEKQLDEKSRKAARKNHISSFREMYKIFKRENNKKYVIIRNLKSLFSIQALLLGLFCRQKVFLYTQNRLHESLPAGRRFFYKALGLLNIRHFTPVLGYTSDPLIPNSSYVPFVIEPLVAVSNAGTDKDVNIVTIGKMIPRKNIRELVLRLVSSKAFNKAGNKLTIIAECSTASNEQYYADLKTIIAANEQIRFKIDFNINIPHAEVLKQLQRADLFILPSHDEPAAFSILEAMASGVPVICSDQNGTSCYIEDGVNGYVFKYRKELAGIEEHVDQLLLGERLLNKMGNAALETVKTKHQYDAFHELLSK